MSVKIMLSEKLIDTESIRRVGKFRVSKMSSQDITYDKVHLTSPRQCQLLSLIEIPSVRA